MLMINVGSKNDVKVEAVRQTIRQYPFLNPFLIRSLDVSSRVSPQPKSLQEIVTGAKNRAQDAFILSPCDYSFGIESGLMSVPETKTGYMDMCICAVHDGLDYHLGMSCGFEPPVEVVRLAIEKGLDLDQATKAIGMTNIEKIGHREGIIGLLTKKRVTRKDYTMQSVRMAMIQLENSELYS